ncbi:MAG: HD domain-containing protein, partial [Erysipelotrichaceae bacterium]|nr:HD domain-containing protein [Erysipelotrichaceae bacterium]
MMTTNSINWNYQSWEEAFRALVPAVRQQSVRVASYTQVLYAQACASSFSKQSKEGAIRISAKNVELAYKCALYHQIGKALLPPELQVWRNDFTEHERATYRMYTTNGRILVSKLQERTDRFPKHTTEFTEVPTNNIAWLMIRETAQQHMERWEGGGYPEQRKGTDISAIAQVVGLAKEIDRLCSEVKSESPFEDAMTALVKESDRGFCKELIEVMQACRGQLKAVYRKYIQYTKTLPKTIPLVEKRENRPMGLLYRPMIRGTEGFVAAYEAVPWFKGNLSKEGTDTLYEVSELLKRTELIDDMT